MHRLGGLLGPALPLALALTAATATAETSQEIRAGKTALLYADPIAFSPYFGVSITGGLILTEQTVIELSHTTGSSCTAETCQFETQLTEARLKYFPRNSLYLNFGIAQEQAVWNHGNAWGHTEEDNADFTARASTVGAVFALGNMWQLGGFTIGCDWVGLYLPLATTAFSFSEGDGYNRDSRADDEDQAKEMALGTHLLTLRFHLGMAL